MIRKSGFALLALMALFDLWFLVQIQSVFYSTERAFAIAEADLQEYIHENDNLSTDNLSGEVIYNGRSLLGRILKISSIYTRGHYSYPVHEFAWIYNNGEMQYYLYVSLNPVGQPGILETLTYYQMQPMVPYKR